MVRKNIICVWSNIHKKSAKSKIHNKTNTYCHLTITYYFLYIDGYFNYLILFLINILFYFEVSSMVLIAYNLDSVKAESVFPQFYAGLFLRRPQSAQPFRLASLHYIRSVLLRT